MGHKTGQLQRLNQVIKKLEVNERRDSSADNSPISNLNAFQKAPSSLISNQAVKMNCAVINDIDSVSSNLSNLGTIKL